MRCIRCYLKFTVEKVGFCNLYNSLSNNLIMCYPWRLFQFKQWLRKGLNLRPQSSSILGWWSIIIQNKKRSVSTRSKVEWLLLDTLYHSNFRFIRSSGITDTVSSRKFLEAAMNTDDSQLFFTVFKFFEQRNIRMRGSPKFQPGNIWKLL